MASFSWLTISFGAVKQLPIFSLLFTPRQLLIFKESDAVSRFLVHVGKQISVQRAGLRVEKNEEHMMIILLPVHSKF